MNIALLDLRTVREEDRIFCYNVKKAALKTYVEPIWGWDENEQIEFHCNKWQAQVPEIIRLNGQDIGTIEITKQDDGFHLNEFYLFPEFQKQGIGSHFMDRLVAEADSMSLPTRLQVIKINPAKRLYLRYGFIDIRETKTHFVMERPPR